MIKKNFFKINLNRKSLRLDFGDYEEILRIPHFFFMQFKSYYSFIYKTTLSNSRLDEMFKKIFPIKGNNNSISLNYIDYKLGSCIFNPIQCKSRGINFSAPLKLKLNISDDLNKNIIKPEKFTGDVYLLDMPLITSKGTFVINGTERVVVSQLHKAPGLYFEIDKSKSISVTRPFYIAKIVPQKGVWINFEFDSKDNLLMRIDKKRKILVSTFLKAMELNYLDILDFFFEKKAILLDEAFKMINIVDDFDNAIGDISKLNAIRDSKDNLILDKVFSKKTGELLANINDKISESLLIKFKDHLVDRILILKLNVKDYNIYISNAFRDDFKKSKLESLLDFHKMLKPNDPLTKEAAKYSINTAFFSEDKYMLSEIGRMKLNEKLDLKIKGKTLTKDDIICTIKKLLAIKYGKDSIDDIDHLGHRRVKGIGEILENLFKIAFIKMEKNIKEKLSSADIQDIKLQDLINTKLLNTSVREFFCSSQLSQFMDQTNPLSEITHKRRLSALGPGGLNRERAGFEVRDVHNTHYGRICPIETPEGPNIGLINSLTIYSRVNKYGFLETPYMLIKNRKIMGEIKYLTANSENELILAQATVKVNDFYELRNYEVDCRFKNEFISFNSDKIEYLDVSPKQMISISTALIPFLEHNDANRALMGSNMQRQATPLLNPERPLVGTGVEKLISNDMAFTINAKRSGFVKNVDSTKIVIKVNEDELIDNEIGLDIYRLIKYLRSNQNTCINQIPLVKVGDYVSKGGIIADGPSSDFGELALGQNLLVAFMPWNGYNFEDSIILSENLVRNDKLTSIHIEEFICTVRDIKDGEEEITSDLPNVGDNILKNLDEFGIIKLGSCVKQGDILVGKITKKTDTQTTPEEKLLHAIFGEKALNVENTSLKVPLSVRGVVVDIQTFNKYGISKDKKVFKIEDSKFLNDKNLLKDEYLILENEIVDQMKCLLSNYNNIYNEKISLNELISLDILSYKNLLIKDLRLKWILYLKKIEIDNLRKIYNKRVKMLEDKYKEGDDLPPGVVKIIKISIAVKKKIQIGDKLSGRHGNKGVVSIIAQREDMPYLENGDTIDVILNPLGVPSRMNIGQLLETHLGWASKNLGKKISILRNFLDKNFDSVKKFISDLYNIKRNRINFDDFSKEDIKNFLFDLENGIAIATPSFDGIKEIEIKSLLDFAGLSNSGKVILYDGRTGLKFDNRITVGYQYIMKLNHLVDDKMHARATGSYSLISQQPLGGKAQFGGQRLGEMEVWALEAYGAAYTLQEMLTVKSDDIIGRTKVYKNIIDGKHVMEPGIPEAFNVLSKELLALGLNIELEYNEV